MTPSPLQEPDPGSVATPEEEKKEEPTPETTAVAFVEETKEEEREFATEIVKSVFERLIEGTKQMFISTDIKKNTGLLQKYLEKVYEAQLYSLPADLSEEFQLQTSFAIQPKRQFFYSKLLAIVIGCTEYGKLLNQNGEPRFDNLKEGKEEAEFMANKFEELNYEV